MGINIKSFNKTNRNIRHSKILLLILFFVSQSIYSQSYLGTITKQVNFREGPSADNDIISSLKPNTQIFIVSLETENDYYNVIDIATDKEGYVT